MRFSLILLHHITPFLNVCIIYVLGGCVVYALHVALCNSCLLHCQLVSGLYYVLF